MKPNRLITEISRADLNPNLVKEMYEKYNNGALCAETDILPLYFYLATSSNKSLSLQNLGLQSKSMIFESAFRSKAETPEEREAEEAINLHYAHQCAYQLIDYGYIPYGSHIKYIGPLNDADGHHRTVGIVMGKVEEVPIQKVCIFPERGLSFGMIAGCKLHVYLNKDFSLEALNENLWDPSNRIMKLDDAKQLFQTKLLDKRKEIIQEIDDLIGVKTI